MLLAKQDSSVFVSSPSLPQSEAQLPVDETSIIWKMPPLHVSMLCHAGQWFILKVLRGVEWAGKERSWTGVWQAIAQLLKETRPKALQFYSSRSKTRSLYRQESARDFQNQKPTIDSMFGSYKKHSFKIALINSKTDLWAVLCSTASSLHSWFIIRIHI